MQTNTLRNNIYSGINICKKKRKKEENMFNILYMNWYFSRNKENTTERSTKNVTWFSLLNQFCPAFFQGFFIAT